MGDFNPSWVTAALGAGSVFATLVITVRASSEHMKVIAMLRRRTRRQAQVLQFLYGHVEAMHRKVFSEDMPDMPRLFEEGEEE